MFLDSVRAVAGVHLSDGAVSPRRALSAAQARVIVRQPRGSSADGRRDRYAVVS